MYITQVSCDPAHAAGATVIIRLFGIWSSQSAALENLLTATSDGNFNFDGEIRAPDLLIRRRLPMTSFPTVIIELEVGNRSGPAMRRDFLNYFAADHGKYIYYIQYTSNHLLYLQIIICRWSSG